MVANRGEDQDNLDRHDMCDDRYLVSSTEVESLVASISRLVEVAPGSERAKAPRNATEYLNAAAVLSLHKSMGNGDATCRPDPTTLDQFASMFPDRSLRGHVLRSSLHACYIRYSHRTLSNGPYSNTTTLLDLDSDVTILDSSRLSTRQRCGYVWRHVVPITVLLVVIAYGFGTMPHNYHRKPSDIIVDIQTL
jgi:hypothetical protein